MATAITADVADVLRRSTISGNVLQLPGGQLERPLYVATDRVLQALGGKWCRKSSGHRFPFDPSEKIAEALGAGKAVSPEQQRVEEIAGKVAAKAKREQERRWRAEEQAEWDDMLRAYNAHREDCLCAAVRGEPFACIQRRPKEQAS